VGRLPNDGNLDDIADVHLTSRVLLRQEIWTCGAMVSSRGEKVSEIYRPALRCCRLDGDACPRE